MNFKPDKDALPNWIRGWLRIIVALSLPFIACLFQLWLWFLIKPLTWILFYPSIFIATWVGGLRFGLVATAISAILGWYFFMPPEREFFKGDSGFLVSSFIFIAFGVFLSFFRERVNKSDQMLREKNDSLEKANKEVKLLYEKSKELDNIKSQFFANVSHELRTPLTLILGPVESLLKEGGFSDKNRSALEMIHKNSRRLLKQVNDLLEVAKLEAGKTEIKYSEFDLSKFVRYIASNFTSLAQENKIKFSIETPDSLSAQLDADKIEQVILNLISNAFKFTPAGGQIRCTLRLQLSTQTAVIEVADNGPGIEEKYRKSLFQRFFRIEEGKQVGGTGLGLSIVKDFVELQGGSVSVDKAPEGGALFTVILPTIAPKGPEIKKLQIETTQSPLILSELMPRHSTEGDKVAAEKSVSKKPESRLMKPLVLVVDDTQDMLDYICQILESDQLQIETAKNGREGLEKAKDLHPDMIVSDIMMPEMNGDQMFREIRAINEFKSIPFILVTAKADETLRMELLKEGALDYLIKPFLPVELQAKVRNFLAAINAENKYKMVLESSQDAVVIVGADGKIIFANNQTMSWFGYVKDELIGQPIELLIPLRFRKTHVENRNKYLHEPVAKQMAERMEDLVARRKDGSEFPVSIALTPLYTPDGLIVTAIIRDITEMKRLSARALKAEQMQSFENLKASEEKYRNLFENSLVAVFSIDMKTLRTIIVNDIAVQLFGYKSVQDFLDNFDPLTHFINTNEWESDIEVVKEKGELRKKVQEMKRLDGTHFWAKLYIKLDSSKNQAETVIIDITHQVELREKLAGKVKELESLNKELESFNYISSHDLQEPLRKTKNFVSVLLKSEKKNLSKEGQYYLERMSETSQQMQSLIEGLLAYSRIKSAVRNFEKTNLNTILEEVIKDFNGLIKEKNVIIKSERLCETNVIRFQIKQLLNNLSSINKNKRFELCFLYHI